MNQEEKEAIDEYIRNAEQRRNTCLFRNQTTGFIYYQGIIDGLAMYITDMDFEEKKNGHVDVT